MAALGLNQSTSQGSMTPTATATATAVLYSRSRSHDSLDVSIRDKQSKKRRSPKRTSVSPSSSSTNTASANRILTLLRLTIAVCGVVFLVVCVASQNYLTQQVSRHDSSTRSSTLLRQDWSVVRRAQQQQVVGQQEEQAVGQQDLPPPLQPQQSPNLIQPVVPPLVPSLFPPPLKHESRLLLGDPPPPKPSSSTSGDRQQLSIPFWDQSLVFRKRHSWKLVVAIMAEDCLPQYKHTPQNSKTFPEQQQSHFPTLLTLQDALQTNHASIMIYFPQTPTSTLYPQVSQNMQTQHRTCQAKLKATIQTLYPSELQSQKLQFVDGIVNPLPSRIAYEAHHVWPTALKQLDEMKLPPDQIQSAQHKIKRRLQGQQLYLEQQYSLGLDFAYIAELIYTYASPQQDLLFFVTSGTRLTNSTTNTNNNNTTLSSPTRTSQSDYGLAMIQQYEHFQQRMTHDLLVHRFCYMSFLQQDTWRKWPPVASNATAEEMPPRYQASLNLPTGILMERYGLYRMSMVLRSLLPYHKETTAQLLLTYCTQLLWEAQIVQPIDEQVAFSNLTAPVEVEESAFPPALWMAVEDNAAAASASASALVEAQQQQVLPVIPDNVLQGYVQQQESFATLSASIPSWVTVDNKQLGPQRTTSAANLLMQPKNATTTSSATLTAKPKKLVTFVVPTSTRPNGIKNQYVTHSLNQLFPLIRRDFRENGGTLQASVLLVICGNTQEDLDDHQNGLWEYYGPEIKEGILEIVSTNLETYPSLHNLPNNYNDNEARLRWRSKQNLDISSSFFAAKGKSEYVMLLEDDTGYRDKFTTTLRAMIQADTRQEATNIPPVMPDSSITGFEPDVVGKAQAQQEDFRLHNFAQVHFGFGYSGVLIHDDDALVYAVLHYVLMDEKPCDLLFLANFMQGAVLDQKWRWQLKRVLLTHLGSVSSLKGKFQPVWGLKG